MRGIFDDTISTCEGVVADFFKTQPSPICQAHAKKMHELFHKKLDFILNEGSLKKDLLHFGNFSDEEISYLQTHSADFCQITEFFMNGFKLGLETPEFSADKYIVPISTAVFKPFTKSTVFLPPSYAKLYSSISTGVPGALSCCFAVSRDFEPKSKVTTLSVGVKV